ncbi:MAG: amidohydrolase family protein [Acidimicrobiia bacterium]
MTNYDVVIRNGTVVDGSGMAGYRADVGIVGDRIARIGRIAERGAQEIDATGHIVTPGFVDLHTHMDAQVFWDPLGSCSCWHGVTTVLMGNCGFSLAPAHDANRDLVVRNIERAEAIDPGAMAAGIEWTWQGFDQYLDAVDKRPKGINYAALVGHSAVRTWVMGEEAFSREATADEVGKMRAVLAEAMRSGAWGMSTSRSWAHLTPAGDPVASRQASWDEVRALVDVIADHGTGVFEIAPEMASFSTDAAERAEYHERVKELAVDSGVPILFGIVPAKPASDDQLAMLSATAEAGGRAIGLSHSRGITIMLSFKTNLPFDRLPTWREVRSLPLDQQRAALSDPDTRHRLVRAAREEPFGDAVGAEARRPNYKAIMVVDSPIPPYKTVAAMADERGVDPVELMIDLALETDFDQWFMQPTSRFDDDGLLEVMRHPHSVMTFSDSGAHVNQIMDSSIHTHLLAYWVREKQVFTIEEAIRMITLAPAVAGGFNDRGLLREGMIADINVIDPTTVAPRMPEVVYDLPAGAQRLLQTADGFMATLVAGQVVIADGEHTGALPGRLIRSS